MPNQTKRCCQQVPPQGALLGGLIFIIKYNAALLRPPIPRPITRPISSSKSITVKYIDDGTVAVSVDLKVSLVPETDKPRPHTYDERTEHSLPSENNLLQYYLEDTENFTAQNKMIINKTKTVAIKFNTSRNWDFPLELKFLDGSSVNVCSELKLLGLYITGNLKWDRNTEYICTKARQRLWILRRLMKYHLTTAQLFDVYQKEIRSILELGVPVWHSSLSKALTRKIENVQKLAFKIILKNEYLNYESACIQLGTQSLKERRTMICNKFALKNIEPFYVSKTGAQRKLKKKAKTSHGSQVQHQQILQRQFTLPCWAYQFSLDSLIDTPCYLWTMGSCPG